MTTRAAPRRAPARPAPVGLDVLEQLRVIVRLASAHSAGLERSTGLPGAQLWALHEVGADDGLRVGELAQRMRVHQTTVSNLLHRLEAHGLVKKARSAADGRVVRVHLTAAGRRSLRKSPGLAGRGLLPSVLDGMDGAQLRKVHAGLALLLDRLGGVDADRAHRPPPSTEGNGSAMPPRGRKAAAR